MKKLAITTAGVFLIAPALAVAAQPTQSAPASPPAAAAAPAQAATQAKDPAAATPAKDPAAAQDSTAPAKDAGTADATCSTTAKSSAKTEASHPSAKVGKDTGDIPPPRKKPSSDSSCASQPQ